VLWRLLGPEVPPATNGAQRRPSSITGRTVVAGNHEFFVREAGSPDAPPLVLLHGWVYDGLTTWHKVMPLLASTFRVVAIDLRAHGKTDRIRGRFEMEDLADEVARCLDALGLGRVALAGYSMGGMVAQVLAIRHPARVERLVLVATAARPIRLPRSVILPVFTVGRTLARIDRITLPRIAHRYLTGTGAVASEHAAWLWESVMNRDADLHYEAAFAIARFDARDRLDRIRVPALVVVPTRDQMIPPSAQRETASLLPDATLVEIEGARHEAMLTHTGQATDAILTFLS
jgi:3-oxoadipate enol-lactonase